MVVAKNKDFAIRACVQPHAPAQLHGRIQEAICRHQVLNAAGGRADRWCALDLRSWVDHHTVVKPAVRAEAGALGCGLAHRRGPRDSGDTQCPE